MVSDCAAEVSWVATNAWFTEVEPSSLGTVRLSCLRRGRSEVTLGDDSGVSDRALPFSSERQETQLKKFIKFFTKSYL